MTVVLFVGLSLPVFGQTASTQWYVNVNYTGGGSNGSAQMPFVNFADVMSSGVGLQPGDQILIAPGEYHDGSGGGEDFKTAGYLIPIGISLHFWDVNGALPSADPGQVVFSTYQGANSAFRHNYLKNLQESGYFFYGAVQPILPGQESKRLLIRNFKQAAISVQLNFQTLGQSDGGMTIDGVAFEDCGGAVSIEQGIEDQRYSFQLSRLRVTFPTMAAVSGGVEGTLQAVRVEATGGGSLEIAAENMQIEPSDQNHSGSGFTFLATEHSTSGQSLDAEFKNCTITGKDGYRISGAGVEALSKTKGVINLKFSNSTIKDCAGDGIICESLGVQGASITSQISLICKNSEISSNGKIGASTPILSGSGMVAGFSQSGIHLASREGALFPLVRLNDCLVEKNGRHGLNLQSTGQYEFASSFPKVQCWGSSLSDNGELEGAEVAHGIFGNLANDGINLELERSLFARNSTTGVTIVVVDQQNGPRNGKCTVTNCVFTENQGVVPQFGLVIDQTPFRFSGDTDYKAIFRFSHTTIAHNPQSKYAIAITDAGGSGNLTLWQPTSEVENCVLRENGKSLTPAEDISFFPLANTDFWSEVFSTTYNSNLNNAGDPNPNYTTDRDNFYDEPILVAYAVQTLNGLYDFGVTFPSTPSQGPISPLLERGRSPQIPEMEANKDIRSFFRPVDLSGIPNFYSGIFFDVGAFEVQEGE